MKEYFVHDGQSEKGPYTFEQLSSLPLKKDTSIWFEGLEQWTNAGNIDELKELFSSKPIPPPLTKTINESLAGAYVPTSETPKPQPKKKKNLLPLGILAAIATCIIIWLIFQNKENSETINSLQSQVSTQQLEQQQKEEEQKKKEDEQRLANEAIAKKNRNYRNNWETYIKMTFDQPQVSYGLGGISQFRVYVSNSTEYMLEQLDVQVEYIRKNGDLWQERTVSFFNIAPGAVETEIAPNSVNGVRVNVTIKKIVSKKMHFCYPSGSGGANDPYFCN